MSRVENFFLGMNDIILRSVVINDFFNRLMLFQHLLMVAPALDGIFSSDILRHQCMRPFSSLGLLVFLKDMSIFYQEIYVLFMLALQPVTNLVEIHSLAVLLFLLE